MYTGPMTRYRDSEAYTSTRSNLVDAVREGADLSDAEWKQLHQLATPFQRRVAALLEDPTLAPHGVPSTYTNWGCRCPECTASRRTGKTDKDFASPVPGPKPRAEMTRIEKIVEAKEKHGLTLTEEAEKEYADWKRDQESVI